MKTKMTIEIKTKDGYEPELKLANMLKTEYAVIEKLYEEPKTGTGTNSDGSFDWTLYGVAVHEYKTLNEESGAMEVTTLNPPVNMSFFKSAKSFKNKFDPLAVNTKMKVTQTPVEGKAYKEFQIEELGAGTAKPVEAEAPAEAAKPAMSVSEQIVALKAAGLDLTGITAAVVAAHPGQTAATVEAVYNSL